MSNRETSAEIASLAARVLATDPREGDEHTSFNVLLVQAKRLAGSALSQREEDETPGTHAYDLLASMAKADVENTIVLIQLVAATVLSKLIDEEGGGRSNITFSPKDMDDMLRRYEMIGEHDGLDTKITLRFKDEPDTTGIATQDEDVENAKPQALPEDERPVWAIGYFTSHHPGLHLAKCLDKKDAEAHLQDYAEEGMTPPAVENRMCMHPDCPSQHCNSPDQARN